MTNQAFKKVLHGKHVRLEHYTKSHRTDLEAAASHPDIWTYVKPSDQTISAFVSDYLDKLEEENDAGRQYPYVVINSKTNEIVGSTRYYDISMRDTRLAIGFTWYHPSVWGTAINPESKYLLLDQVFDNMAFNRVEFHIDSRNDRSLAAVKKLGAVTEGTLRKHRFVQGDFLRDTVIASLIQSDWPDSKHSLLERIS